MAPKRNKKRKATPVADGVGSGVARAALPGPIEDPFSEGQVRHVVTMVALRRGVVSQEVNNWVVAVSNNLESVGISTLRDLVESGSTMNVLLSRAGLPRLHGTTVQEMLHEVCRMVQWPGDEPDADGE
jgi:hypothetical protein